MRFRVLGPLEVYDGARWTGVPAAKHRSLLAFLLLNADRMVPVDRLVEVLWGQRPPQAATNLVQQYVMRVRRNLNRHPGKLVVTHPGGYELVLTELDELDSRQFTNLLADGQRALNTGQVEQAAALLTNALGLWRGPALADVSPTPAIMAEVTRLEEQRMTALEARIDADLSSGRHHDLVAELWTLVRDQPLRERWWGQLMVALYRSGRQADALGAFREVSQLLRNELAVEPGADLVRLHQQILNADPMLAPQHRSAGRASAPPRPAQLPLDLATFTGRTAERDWLLSAYPDSQASSRSGPVVITAIDGMPGVGKTALAVHAAHRLAPSFPDGQLFIDLHGYTQGVAPVEPGDALGRLLRALGIPGEQIPDQLDERAALYRSQLAGRRMLILVDNAAAETQVRPLLPGTPGCLALVTSRCRLAGLDDARQLALDVLPPPDAVTLFIRTAGTDRLAGYPPELLTETVELCGRLPLAIRIAAARLGSHPSWSPMHLVERLRDQRLRLSELEAGSRSVTAALALSYQQLTADQQRLYRLLGIHSGPDFEPYAAAALTNTTLVTASRRLDQLLDAHLLQEPAPGRYVFHDLVRAHAASAAADEETGPQRRAALSGLLDHYRHTASVAMGAAYPYERQRRPQVPPAGTPTPDLPDSPRAIVWLDKELANLLAAARYATDHGLPEHTVDLSSTLHRHLYNRGLYSDADQLHQQALTAARTAGDRAGELHALIGLGEVYWIQGRYQQAIDLYHPALEIARATGHRTGELAALIGLGRAHRMPGRHELATVHFGQALEIARATGHRSGELDALIGLGLIHLTRGRHELAIDHFGQALEIARATGHRTGELTALIGRGHIHRLQGRYAHALDDAEQALGIARTTSHCAGELAVLIDLGHIHRRQGRYEQATDHYQHALDVAREIGNRNLQFEAIHGLGRLRRVAGHPELALRCHRQALDLAIDLGQPDEQARAHDGLAHAHHALAQHEQARQHWRHALDILTNLGTDHTEDEETSVSTIRTHLAGPRSQPAAGTP